MGAPLGPLVVARRPSRSQRNGGNIAKNPPPYITPTISRRSHGLTSGQKLMSTHALIERDRALDRLRELQVTIFGARGAGRQIALNLVALGLRKLTVIDDGLVPHVDVMTAGYRADDVGRPRVDAVGDACHQAQPLLDYHGITDLSRSVDDLGVHVFWCLEAPGARRTIWERIGERCEFWCDIRTDFQQVRVTSAVNHPGEGQNARGADARRSRDHNSRTLVIEAGLAASLAVHQLLQHLGSRPVHDIMLDLTTGRCEGIGGI